MDEDERRRIILLHDLYVTSLISRYRRKLELIVSVAVARTVSEVQRKLTLGPGGIIESTPANQRVLRSVDSIFIAQMEKAGYSDLSKAFADSFAGQLPFVDDLLNTLAPNLKKKIEGGQAQSDAPGRTDNAAGGILESTKAPGSTGVYSVRDVIDAEDRKELASQQLSVVDNLQAVVEQAAATTKQKVLLGGGSAAVTEVAAILANGLGKITPAASAIADTSATMFFRVVTEKAYDVIQNDIPGDVLRFEYEGPDDTLTREYCIQMLARTKKKPLTKAEINEFPNGQLPSPFLSCGGWNCRHQYVISLN